MSTENQPNIPTPIIPQTPVSVQSLTATGLTGQVMPPSARSASGSVPALYPHQPHIEVGMLEPEYAQSAEEYEAAPQVDLNPPRKRSAFARYWDKIGGGSLTLSLLIHGGLIALFILIVYTTTIEPKVDFLSGGGSKQGQEASTNLAHQVENKKRTNMNKTTPMRKIASANLNASISLPEMPIETLDVSDMALPSGGSAGSGGLGGAGAGGGAGNGIGRGTQSGFTALPPSMKQRCSSMERLQKLKESGGSPECEKAVSTALEYLKSKQNPDGSWGKTNKGAMTGLALLCYLGRCETPDSLYYGDNVMKGLLYLVELSKKNPEGMMAEKMTANYTPYEHGIATYALGEMYTLARLGGKPLPGVREAYEQGVKTIIKYQHDSGSWVYNTTTGNYAPSGREDLSVTGWQYQALKSAKLSGLKFDKLHVAIDKTVKYLQSRQTADGGYGTANRGGHYNQWDLSGVGILGLQTLGHGKSSEIKKGIKFAHELFEKEPPTWSNVNLYAWYYYAQAFFQNGGPEWKYWNETALPVILKNQNKDGSWTPTLTAAKGGTSGGDGIYSTALCTLMLEVYYRYLKVGDRESSSTSIFTPRK